MRATFLIGLTVASLAIAACSDSESWGGIEVEFDTKDESPAWSPDGRLIAFTSNRDGGGLFVVKPDGKGIRRLTATKSENPEWSPNGKELVYETRTGIYALDVASAKERLVARAKKTGEGEHAPAWSPDGRRIVFSSQLDNLAYALFVVDRAGGKPRRLLPEPVLADDDPAWSADAVSELAPSWSRDGKRIAYATGDGSVMVVRLADRKRSSMPLDPDSQEPAWSPDGSRLAFGCSNSLCTVDLATQEVVTLLGDAGAPSWSPDGKRLVAERYLYGAPEAFATPMALYVVAADESGADVLTWGPGEKPD